MSSTELIVRIILALVFPPLGVIGMRNSGCGSFLLLLLLTFLFYIPGQIVAIYLIVQEHSKQN